MVRAAETLSDEESAKLHDAMHDAMHAADPSGGLEKCWQGKEMLRRLLALAGTEPDRNLIWTRLTDFYTHCADSEVAQPRRLAWTVHAWQPSIIEGLITGISNGRTKGYNRIVRHVGRIAFGFRSTENHKTPDTIRLNPRITPGANQSPQALLMPKSRQMGHPIAMRRALVCAAVINEGHRRDGVPTLAGVSQRAALGAFAGPSRPNAVPAPRVRIGWAPL